MDTPTCARCKTSDYLRFTVIEEPHAVEMSFPMQGGTHTRTRQVPGYLEHFCHSCGLTGGGSIEAEWEGPVRSPNVEPLIARGDYWPEPRQHAVRQQDGSWSTAVGHGG